jgi:hypothetical protein
MVRHITATWRTHFLCRHEGKLLKPNHERLRVIPIVATSQSNEERTVDFLKRWKISSFLIFSLHTIFIADSEVMFNVVAGDSPATRSLNHYHKRQKQSVIAKQFEVNVSKKGVTTGGV